MVVPEERCIITLAGPKGCGKSTIGLYIQHNVELSLNFPMAEPIKQMIGTLLGAGIGMDTEEARERVMGGQKEDPIEDLGGVTARKLMQTLGTEWGRDTIDQDIWAKIFQSRVRFYMGDNPQFDRPANLVISDDVRFENEIRLVKAVADELGVRHYHVIVSRDGVEHSTEHRSEEGVSDEVLEEIGTTVIRIDNSGEVRDSVISAMEQIFPLTLQAKVEAMLKEEGQELPELVEH